jgi:hypothetical protein
MRNALLLCLVLTMGSGCKDSNTPAAGDPATTASAMSAVTAVPSEPSATASAEPAGLRGGWTVHLRSEAPGLNPDLFDTPEKKAKVFFDHHAQVNDGRVEVKHGTLNQSWPMKDAAQAFDTLMASTDWSALEQQLGKEGGSEGGTIFHFTIMHAGTKHELKTANLDAYPPLLEIVKTLKATAGVP